MKLSVIIVNYNVKYFVWQCLRSVFLAMRNIDGEVLVVDNDSDDGSVDFLETEFPASQYSNLRIIRNKENLGFGRANNIAAELCNGEYVLFLNPDTIVSEDTFTQCISFAETKENFGGLGVKMLHDNGSFAYESRRGIPTPWTAFCKLSGLAAIFPKSRIFGKYYLRYLDKEQPSEIEIISGAFMFLSRKALDDVGLFDERFFMYGEDIDLSYRLLLKGYRNYYIPAAILHYKGESTRKNSYSHVKTFYQAMSIFFRKHNRGGALQKIAVETAIKMATFLSIISKTINRGLKNIHFRSEGQIEDNANMLTLDTSTHSFREILSTLENSDHRHFIAMKYPSRHIIITSGKTLTYE